MRVSIPERFGRRMSIGPFEDPRDFLRFVLFALSGALVAMVLGLPWGLPIVLCGLVLTLFKRKEETLLAHLIRRVAYLGSGRTVPPQKGSLGTNGWRDPWGRHWVFYSREPLPIAGQSPEELQARSLRLVKILASTNVSELIFARCPEPCSTAAFVPEGRGVETRAFHQYLELLERSALWRFQARLVLALPTSAGERFSASEALRAEGWTPLKGSALRGVARNLFPLLPTS